MLKLVWFGGGRLGKEGHMRRIQASARLPRFPPQLEYATHLGLGERLAELLGETGQRIAQVEEVQRARTLAGKHARRKGSDTLRRADTRHDADLAGDAARADVLARRLADTVEHGCAYGDGLVLVEHWVSIPGETR